MEESKMKCENCKIFKPESFFYRQKYCKRCYIKDYVEKHLSYARIAHHLNLSIEELKNILTVKDGPDRNLLGEHDRYDEVMLYLTGWNMKPSSIITEETIDKFLDESF